MNISQEWLLNLKKRFILADGWISAENLSNFGEVCFRLGIQWLYKWRRILIEQPKDRDIILVKRFDTEHPKMYKVCIYLAGSKSIIELSTGRKLQVNSTTLWKLIETQETIERFDMSKFNNIDPCDCDCKEKQSIDM